MMRRIAMALRVVLHAVMLPLMERSAWFRAFIERPRDYNRSRWARECYRLLWRYWERQPYRTVRSEEFQRAYWNTLGRYREFGYRRHDYGPFLETLSRCCKDDGVRTVLELGCGNGRILRELADQYPQLQLTGVDLSEGMLEVAKTVYAHPHVRVVCDSMTAFLATVSAGAFDVIYTRSALTCVDESLIERMLRGIAAIAPRFVAMAEPSGTHDDRKGVHTERVNADCYKRLHDQTHIRDYGAYWCRLGLSVVSMRREMLDAGDTVATIIELVRQPEASEVMR